MWPFLTALHCRIRQNTVLWKMKIKKHKIFKNSPCMQVCDFVWALCASSVRSLSCIFWKTQKSQFVLPLMIPWFWGGPKRTVLTSERVAKLNGPKTQEKKKVVSRPTRAPVVSSYHIGFRFFLCESHSCLVVFATCFFLRFRRSTPAYIFTLSEW